MRLAPPPPSRLSNPFATCWTRPDVLSRYEQAGQGADELLVRLERTAWRGQVVGPHGAGKSSLLGEVARRLPGKGRLPLWMPVEMGKIRPAIQTIRRSADERTVVLLEGFERASRWQQWRLLATCAGTGSGWLLTTHRKLLMTRETPVVARLEPTVETALHLYEHLTAEKVTPITRNDVARSFQKQGANLRKVWFDLYEQHEAKTRQRTATVATTYS